MPKFKLPSIPSLSDLQIMVTGIVVTTALIGGAFGIVYFKGDAHGAKRIQTAWDKNKAAYEKLLAETRNHYHWKMGVNAEETRVISGKLEEANEKYDKDIIAVRATLRGRLQLSEQRAAAYERAAGGSAAERDNLASHAGKLDRTLEEGRGLVQELGAALRQRDTQVNLLGEQILSDRKLFTDDRAEVTNGTK